MITPLSEIMSHLNLPFYQVFNNSFPIHKKSFAICVPIENKGK